MDAICPRRPNFSSHRGCCSCWMRTPRVRSSQRRDATMRMNFLTFFRCFRDICARHTNVWSRIGISVPKSSLNHCMNRRKNKESTRHLVPYRCVQCCPLHLHSKFRQQLLSNQMMTKRNGRRTLTKSCSNSGLPFSFRSSNTRHVAVNVRPNNIVDLDHPQRDYNNVNVLSCVEVDTDGTS